MLSLGEASPTADLDRAEQQAFEAAQRARRVGDLIFRGAVAAMAVISLGLNVGLFAVYQTNRMNNGYGNSYVEWDSVWFGWGIVTGTWLVYMLILGVVASVGAATSAKGHSLTLQLVDVE